MQIVRDFSIGNAHIQAVRRVVNHGKYVKTEDGEETVELNEPLNIFVATPMAEPRISKHCTFGEKAMEKYVEELLVGCENEFVYTYHDRLFGYPFSRPKDDGKTYRLDQINEVIVNLHKNPTSRRAQAITWIPPLDLFSDSPPCLQRIQFLIRGGKLNMQADFRSRDILSAMGPNMYALTRLQEMVAKLLEVEVGWYSDTSVSAHVYFARDIYELKKYYEIYAEKELLENLRRNTY